MEFLSSPLNSGGGQSMRGHSRGEDKNEATLSIPEAPFLRDRLGFLSPPPPHTRTHTHADAHTHADIYYPHLMAVPPLGFATRIQ